MHTHQEAVSVGRLERVLGELADQLGDGQFVVAADMVQHAQSMVLQTVTHITIITRFEKTKQKLTYYIK